jgi:hypothetical protein
MSDSGSSGMGFGAETSTAQSDRARANASQRQGNGRLLGPRADRDVSRPKTHSIPPPEPPETRWAPPKQEFSNPKGPRL